MPFSSLRSRRWLPFCRRESSGHRASELDADEATGNHGSERDGPFSARRLVRAAVSGVQKMGRLLRNPISCCFESSVEENGSLSEESSPGVLDVLRGAGQDVEQPHRGASVHHVSNIAAYQRLMAVPLFQERGSAVAMENVHRNGVREFEEATEGDGKDDAWMPSDFELVSMLGYGASGAVFRARLKSGVFYVVDGRQMEVAVKWVKPWYVQGGFIDDEIYALHLLKGHPNVIELLHTFQAGGHGYIVTEVSNGPALDDLLLEKENISERDALHIVSDVFNVLTFMHGRGCAHLDIKSSNLLLRDWPSGDANDVPNSIVIDFGLVHFATDDDSVYDRVPGAGCGTAGYRAPEVVDGDYSAGYADVWSTAVVLFELLTGVLPFPENSHEETCIEVGRGWDALMQGDSINSVSPRCQQLLRRCLEVDPSRRPTAHEALLEVSAIRKMHGWV